MHIPTLVRYLVDEPHQNVGADVPAIVVKIHDAETGKVDLQVMRQLCHGSYLVRDVLYGDDVGTWHREGE